MSLSSANSYLQTMEDKELIENNDGLIEDIVQEFMSTGKFDNLRRKIVSGIDTKTAFQSVQQRMQSAVKTYLSNHDWKQDLNKNQLRDSIKRHLLTAPFLESGISRIVDQVVNDSLMKEIRPHVLTFTHKVLGLTYEENEEEMDVTGRETSTINNGSEIKGEPSLEFLGSSGYIKQEPEEPPPPVKDIKTQIYEDVVVPGEEVIELKKTKNSPSAESMDELSKEGSMEVSENFLEQANEGSEEDSDHSIINQMSPISFRGSPSPSPPPLPTPQEATASQTAATKRASDFIGKIPKLKKNETKEVVKDNSPHKEFKNSPRKDDSTKYKNGARDHRKEEKERDRRSDKKSDKSSDRSKEKNLADKDKGKSKHTVDRGKDKDRSRSSSRSHKSSDKEKYEHNKDKSKKEKAKTESSEDQSSRDTVFDGEKIRNMERSQDKSRSRKDKDKSRERNSGKSSSSSKGSSRETSSSRSSSKR